MLRVILSIIFSLSVLACGTTPEIPYNAQVIPQKQSLPKDTAKKTSPKKANYSRYLANTGLRFQEADCQVYSKPNMYSQRVKTAKGGKEVWTEDTGSAWYKIYRDKSYGYMSKICFNN